jgi:hypothetical protein
MVATDERLQNGNTTPATTVLAAKTTTKLAFAVYTPFEIAVVVEPLLQTCDLGSSLRFVTGVLAEASLDAVIVAVASSAF